MSTTQLPAAPSWATEVDDCDAGQPEGYTIYQAAFGSLPRLKTTSFTRTGTLRVLGFQYTNDEGDVPAGTPTLEIWSVDEGGLGVAEVLLTVDDAIALAGLLVEAAEKMAEAAR